MLPLGWWWHTPEDTLDKIDADLLARDTRIFTHGVLRLVLSEKLPLDYAAYARELQSELLALQIGDGAVDTGALAELAGSLADRLAMVDGQEANETLRILSRVLVPMESTKADRFSHDPALPISHSPALDPFRALKAATPGTDAFRHAEVGAVRAANRVRHTLRAAKAVLGD